MSTMLTALVTAIKWSVTDGNSMVHIIGECPDKCRSTSAQICVVKSALVHDHNGMQLPQDTIPGEGSPPDTHCNVRM